MFKGQPSVLPSGNWVTRGFALLSGFPAQPLGVVLCPGVFLFFLRLGIQTLHYLSLISLFPCSGHLADIYRSSVLLSFEGLCGRAWHCFPLCVCGIWLPSCLWGGQVETSLEGGGLGQVWVRILQRGWGGGLQGAEGKSLLPEPATSLPFLLALFPPLPFLSLLVLHLCFYLRPTGAHQDQRICRINWLVVGDFLEREYFSLDFQRQVTWVSWERHGGE